MCSLQNINLISKKNIITYRCLIQINFKQFLFVNRKFVMLINKKINLSGLLGATPALGVEFYKESIQKSLNFSNKRKENYKKYLKFKNFIITVIFTGIYHMYVAYKLLI